MANRRALCSFGVAIVLLGAVASADPPEQNRAGPQPVESYEVPPKAVHVTRPVYPPKALEQGIEGTVLLDVLIDDSGRPVRVKVTKSIPELDRAAMECVGEWRFSPAQKGGRAVRSTATVPVAFRRDSPNDVTAVLGSPLTPAETPDPYVIGLSVRGGGSCPLIVWGLIQGSPAQVAGVKVGDHLLSIDGLPTNQMDARQASQRIQSTAPGVVRLNLAHGLHSYAVSITRDRRATVIERAGYKADRGMVVPKDTTAAEVTAMESFDETRVLSHVFPLHYPYDLECYTGAFELFMLRDPAEVTVGGIEPGPAARAGLHWGDRILEVGDVALTGKTQAQLESLFCTQTSQNVELVVLRGETTRRISFTTSKTADILRSNGVMLMGSSLVPVGVAAEDVKCLEAK